LLHHPEYGARPRLAARVDPESLFWFLLGLSVVAFASALLFSSVETPLPAAFERESFESPATPPVLPVSKSA
jgi:hypothetical protein